jgi:plasmid stabilization system protein ParE
MAAHMLPAHSPEVRMPRGDKSAYTDKQKRKAEHIEEGYEERGVPEEEAERRAWATVNKMDRGGKKSGSGRGRRPDMAPARKGGRKGGRAAAKARKAGARKAARKTSRTASRRTSSRSSKKK